MKQYFGVGNLQLCDVTIKTVISYVSPHPGILYYLVTSTLLLTPEQSFDTLFEMNSDTPRFSVQSFIHIEKPLSVTVKNITYTIIKTTFRSLSCMKFSMTVVRIIPSTVELRNQEKR